VGKGCLTVWTVEFFASTWTAPAISPENALERSYPRTWALLMIRRTFEQMNSTITAGSFRNASLSRWNDERADKGPVGSLIEKKTDHIT